MTVARQRQKKYISFVRHYNHKCLSIASGQPYFIKSQNPSARHLNPKKSPTNSVNTQINLFIVIAHPYRAASHIQIQIKKFNPRVLYTQKKRTFKLRCSFITRDIFDRLKCFHSWFFFCGLVRHPVYCIPIQSFCYAFFAGKLLKKFFSHSICLHCNTVLLSHWRINISIPEYISFSWRIQSITKRV